MKDYKTLPKNPGIYLFKDKKGKIIYVGKAKSLRKRVASYFTNSDKSPKTRVLVSHIADIDFIIVDNEVEALLLENKYIKQHQPRYNIDLKDAKTYAYLKITDETYPRLVTTRKLSKKGEFFGPYTDGSARRELQQLALRLFKLRTCKTLPKRACLNYHIGLCSAPCENKATKEEYGIQVEGARSLLRGNREIKKELTEEMMKAAAQKKFEIALERRKQIEALDILDHKQKVDLIKTYNQDVIALIQEENQAVAQIFEIKKGVISKKRTFKLEPEPDLFEQFIKALYQNAIPPHEIIVSEKFWTTEKENLEDYLSKLRGTKVRITHPQKGEKLSLINLALKNAAFELEDTVLKDLQTKLNLPTLPITIECFDISHLSATGVVGAMTRWVRRHPDKPNYRKFEIKSSPNKNDDFQAMREVTYRRYRRLKDENKAYPDLILIDGGKGQLSSALWSLRKLGLAIPVVGLAKKEEELYLPDEENPRKYDPDSEVMLYLRQIRDSTHRLVINYQRKKRNLEVR